MTGYIDLSNISIQLLNQHVLVHDFSERFSIHDITLLQGVSGVGKSTLGKFIAHIPQPHAKILGHKSYHHIKPKDIYYVPQHPSQYFIGNEPIKRQMALISPKQTVRISDLLSAMNLNLDQHILNAKPDELSSGMKSRIMLAITLSLSPSYTVIDEPFALVDGLTTKDILTMIKRLNENMGVGFLIISHEWPENSPLIPHKTIQLKKGEP